MEGKRVCMLALALLAHGAQVNCIRPTPVAKLSTVVLDMQTELPSVGRSLLSEDTVPLRNSGNLFEISKATARTLLDANNGADPFAHPRYMLDAPSEVPASPVTFTEPAASEPGPPAVPATATESVTQVVTQLPPVYSPQPSLPLPPSPYSPSPAVEQPSPSPSVTPNSFPSPSVQSVEPAPTCSNPDGCLNVSPSSGTVFDTFTLSTSGWQRTWTTESEILVYEFGVEASSSRKARQLNSALKTAAIVGLGSGQQTLYVCARAATVTIRGNATATTPSGDKACATVTVTVSDQVSQAQVSDQLAALTSFTTASTASSSAAKPSPSETLAMAARLAAVSSVTSNSSSAETKAAVASLASSLLKNLISSTTTSSSPASVADTTAVFSGMNTLLAMASEDSRAAVMEGASHMAEALSSKPVSVEDAGPVVDFFTSMLEDTASLVASAAASAGGGSANVNASQAVADGAKSILASLMRGTAALTQGLLNGAPSNGSVVQISTAKLAAAVEKASAALAAAGITMQVAPPPSVSAASAGRRLLQSAASTVSASLNPAVGSLCSSDPDCSASGLGVQVTVIRDTSLLLTSLGGTAAPLAANLSDYRAGGAASIVSQIVRVAASGIPSSAVGLGSLLVLDLPVNLTAVAAGPANSKRVILRLQDYGAAALEPAVGIAAGPSATVTHDNGGAAAADLVSGYSDRLGEFVVLQYETGANVNSGGASSEPPSQPPSVRPPLRLPNAAGPTVLPSSVLTTLMVGLATAVAAVML